MNWIIGLLGEELYPQVIIAFGGLLEVLICCLFFNVKTPKRRKWISLSLLIVLFLPLFSVFVGYLRLLVTDLFLKNLLYSLCQSAFLCGIIFSCYHLSFYEKCLDFCAVSAAYILTGKLFSVALNIAGTDDFVSMSFFDEMVPVRDWTIYIAVHLVLYLILGIIFREQNQIENNKRSRISVISLSLTTVLFCNLLFSVSRIYEPQSRPMAIITKIFACICCLIILVLRSGILYQSKTEQEMLILNELFHQETKQFESLRSNIDIINSKCHDLRHQLNTFEGKLTAQEISELKEATRIYDSAWKTGYDVLDAILYEKQLLCENSKIRLTCIADGNAVRFLDTTHLYSLLSNALNNAIEACKTLSEEHRTVGLSIKKSMGFTVIEVFNYCFSDIQFRDHVPVTTKKDKQHHGYGYKSMLYIASEYDGNVIASLNGTLFSLKIYLSDPADSGI